MTEQNIQLTKKLRESIKKLEQLRKALTNVLNSVDAERQILLEMRINLLKPLIKKYQYLLQRSKESKLKTRYLHNLLHTKTIEADNLKRLSEGVINQRSTLQ